jgi:transcriptional regulator with XRE-family HTH domain
MTRLAEYLEKKNITQTELYHLVNQKCKHPITKNMINRIVNGKQANYHIFTLIKIALVLKCSLNQLVDIKQYRGLLNE